MKNDFESNNRSEFQIVLPDVENTGLDFEGLVTELPLTIPADDKITADVTIQVTGKVEISSGGTTTP
jgi:predicted secreted protein